MVAVVLVTVGMSAFFANLAATTEIQWLKGQGGQYNQRLSDLLAFQYSENRGWSGAQGLLGRVGALFGERVVLADGEGVVVADTDETLLGLRLDPNLNSQLTLPVSGPSGPLGTLIINPGSLSGAAADGGRFSESSGPSLSLLLILSGLLAVAVAMVLTFFLSRRVVAPVEALAKVAQAVARRDFSVRAEAGSRDEVGELTRTFNSMVSELSRTEELRRNLVADLAHELRTPVTNIQGYIEGLADGVMAPEGETMDSMHGEVRLLTRLIEDLQDLALAESGQLRLSVHSCNLASLARRAVTAIQQQAQAKQIALRVDVPAELPVQVDPERISQVLRNLLANAVEYTPTGGEVLLLAPEGGPEVRLAVRDTGPGIPADDLPYVFERFYRVDKSRSRATGGVGLGLTIARRLVEAHGGDIEVHSEPGEGTEFVVSLPRNGNGPSAKV